MQEITTKFLNQKITFSLNEDKFNIFFGENARGGSVIFEEKEISENLLLRKLCMDNNVPDFVGYLADKYTLETKLYELKKLQGVPKDYTSGVPKGERGKMLGNGWTVDVIAHIFKNIPLT